MGTGTAKTDVRRKITKRKGRTLKQSPHGACLSDSSSLLQRIIVFWSISLFCWLDGEEPRQRDEAAKESIEKHGASIEKMYRINRESLEVSYRYHRGIYYRQGTETMERVYRKHTASIQKRYRAQNQGRGAAPLGCD
jgi:hypothetical protein